MQFSVTPAVSRSAPKSMLLIMSEVCLARLAWHRSRSKEAVAMRTFCAFTVRVLLITAALTTALRGEQPTDHEVEVALTESYNFRTLLNDNARAQVENGVVTLTGTVENRYQRALAEDTARTIPGVQEVHNHLDVLSPGRVRSDGWIELRIRGMLFVREGVSGKSTDITVREGVVTLRGVADNPVQKELTENYARQVDGVRAVRNEMSVADEPTEERSRPLAATGHR
jgi:hypothetical protein